MGDERDRNGIKQDSHHPHLDWEDMEQNDHDTFWDGPRCLGVSHNVSMFSPVKMFQVWWLSRMEGGLLRFNGLVDSKQQTENHLDVRTSRVFWDNSTEQLSQAMRQTVSERRRLDEKPWGWYNNCSFWTTCCCCFFFCVDLALPIASAKQRRGPISIEISNGPMIQMSSESDLPIFYKWVCLKIG